MAPAHYKDLRELYTKRMESHGLGVALFHPIAAQDMRPPCCGYFDRNGDWNLICNLLPESQPPFHPTCPELGFDELEYTPAPSMDIGIEWQPKTASGTQEHVVAGSVETPDNQPGGAEANIKYTSASKFGAVLMTKRPITLTAYNDERLFRSWLEANRGELYKLHGSELKKYGMWLVTRTYASKGASINAWSDANKASVISTKAKAAMLGELGEDLDWQDRMSSRDWSHYAAKTNEGLVVFMDGIDMSPMDWKLEGFKQNLPGARSRNDDDRSDSRNRSEEIASRRRSVGGRLSVATTAVPPWSNGAAASKASVETDTTLTPVSNPTSLTKPPTWALDQVKVMKQEAANDTGKIAFADEPIKKSTQLSTRKHSPRNSTPRTFSNPPRRTQSQRSPRPRPRPDDDPWWYDDGKRFADKSPHLDPNSHASDGSQTRRRSQNSSISPSPKHTSPSLSPSPGQSQSPPSISPNGGAGSLRRSNGSISRSSQRNQADESRRPSAPLGVDPRTNDPLLTVSVHDNPPNNDTTAAEQTTNATAAAAQHSRDEDIEKDILRDTGLLQPLARSITSTPTFNAGAQLGVPTSLSKSMGASGDGGGGGGNGSAPSPSLSASASLSGSGIERRRSLRREVRSISQERDRGS